MGLSFHENLCTSHVTPGENTFGLTWMEIKSTRAGCEFYLLCQGKPKCLVGD